MINGLRGNTIKSNDKREDDIYDLKENKPLQIDKRNNSVILHIKENEEQEDCFIHSFFSDDASAYVCKEFKTNVVENYKKVDISYYYFSLKKEAIVYLYDIKKTFAGEDVILKLIEQWKSSISDARYMTEKIDFALNSSNIHIGVVTENDAKEKRQKDLHPLLHPEEIQDGIPKYLIKQRLADLADQKIKQKILMGFDEGKVTIGDNTYYYDVREFVEKRHDMYFSDGKLAPQESI